MFGYNGDRKQGLTFILKVSLISVWGAVYLSRGKKKNPKHGIKFYTNWNMCSKVFTLWRKRQLTNLQGSSVVRLMATRWNWAYIYIYARRPELRWRVEIEGKQVLTGFFFYFSFLETQKFFLEAVGNNTKMLDLMCSIRDFYLFYL